MAFIRSNDIPTNNVGSIVTLNRDITAIKGTITNGSSVLITGVSNRGYDIIDLESNESLTECGFNIFD